MTPKGEQLRLSVDDGKYTFILKGGSLHILRYGEKWVVQPAGQKAIIALMHEVAESTK
jgi:hypothetical protein